MRMLCGVKEKCKGWLPLLRRNSLEDLFEVDTVLQVVPAYKIVDYDSDHYGHDCGYKSS